MKQLFIYGFILIFMGSCFTSKRKDVYRVAPPTCMTINKGSDNFLYFDFPNRDKNWEGCDIKDEFTDGCIRLGRISKEGYKEGKFITPTCGYFMDKRKRFFKEENFKNGLRDGIYKIINDKNEVVYSTTFKKGTGIWKEFHGNGKLYFEISTKDGYFTDTLRLHDDKGKIIGKRVYKKDSLIYSEGLPCFPYLPESVPSD